MATSPKPRGYHPFQIILNRKIKLEEGEDFEICCDFVREICLEPCCDRTSGHCYTRPCACLSVLIDNAARQAAVAKYMVLFIKKPLQERHSIVMEWIRYTKTRSFTKFYFLPFVADEEGANPFDGDDESLEDGDDDDEIFNNNRHEGLHELKHGMVCKDAISILLDYGRRKWKQCQTKVAKNIVFEHGSKGKLAPKAKRFAAEVEDGLHAFFHEIKQFGSPKTTRFVREETGTGLRDGEDPDLLELPTS